MQRMAYLVNGGFRLWTLRDSNSWPPRCKRGALPAELRARLQQASASKHEPVAEPNFFFATGKPANAIKSLQEQVPTLRNIFFVID